MNVRTRFAPSPTGFLHVGGVRTALFAWLVARQANGKFILRIEDTDKSREVVGAEQHIKDSLKWAGIDWDEGPDNGGPYSPYRQSERLDIYNEWAKKLIDNGRAYADPYSQQELEIFREQAKREKRPFLYRNHRPESPTVWDGKKPLRFRSDPKSYNWHDEVMGDLNSGPEVIDDIILIKSDGYPTYNFCHIVDDALMQITHVIRSQEFISSVPKYLNIYEALDVKPPLMATLPYVMAIDGKKKLSKRDGAKDILDYAKEGYLPETMVNFLATLGWNDGTKQEIFSVEELITKFSIDRVQKAGARFDEQRLLWMNGTWIRSLDSSELYSRCQDFWPNEADNFDENYKKQVLVIVKDRLKTLADLSKLSSFLFVEPEPNLDLIKSNPILGKIDMTELAKLLKISLDTLNEIEFTESIIQSTLNNLLQSTGQQPKVLFSLIRISTTWAPFSPGLSETLNILGKERSLKRLQKAIDLLS